MTGIMESMQETVRGLRTIKAFTLEDGMERRVGEQTGKARSRPTTSPGCPIGRRR